jgi:pheromone shutdown protein TraB
MLLRTTDDGRAMITLVGVGHVFQISAQVKRVIYEKRANAVCVELDPRRYRALIQEGQGAKLPVSYRLLSMFQKRLARQFGSEVGQEMISAVDTAKEMGVDTIFIDVDAGAMFNSLWRQMPLKEKVRLFLSGFIGLFTSKDKVEKELESFQENEEAYMSAFEHHMPTLKKVLIDDRNRLMASRIEMADDRYGNVVAIIGDGHVEGIRKLLEGREVQVTRLSELRSMEPLADDPEKGTGEVTFTFTTQFEE